MVYRNLTELRIFFALCVVIAHSNVLSGNPQGFIMGNIFSSEYAVQGFFIISGFLVMMSYHRTADLLRYYKKRLYRIYPGYLMAILFFLVLALIMSETKLYQLRDIGSYLVANLIFLNFLEPSIPGVFAELRNPEINGALWTIKIEVMFYLLVPIIYFICERVSILIVIFVMACVGMLWPSILDIAGEVIGRDLPLSLDHQLPGQLHYFAIGLLMYAYDKDREHVLFYVGVFASILFCALLIKGMEVPTVMLALVSLIYFVSSLPQLTIFFVKNDISYGVYICHFPIIQLMLSNNWGTAFDGVLFIMLVMMLSITYAVMSWRLIESPFLIKLRKNDKTSY